MFKCLLRVVREGLSKGHHGISRADLRIGKESLEVRAETAEDRWGV